MPSYKSSRVGTIAIESWAGGFDTWELTYRLYATCERKKWAQEALAYNSLVIAWPEISRLARQIRLETETQR